MIEPSSTPRLGGAPHVDACTGLVKTSVIDELVSVYLTTTLRFRVQLRRRLTMESRS